VRTGDKGKRAKDRIIRNTHLSEVTREIKHGAVREEEELRRCCTEEAKNSLGSSRG
jgi:hypothetical protein